MERELINQKKGSRIIQQKGGPGGRVHIVDNRANPVQGLMRGGKVSQRVIQRVNEANRKFVYVENSGAPDFLIPYLPNTIQFTKYQGGEIRSAGFTGCFMMAFRFNSEKDADVNNLFLNPFPGLNYNDTYVAHVDNKEKKAVFDALRRELIIIEAMFRPYNNNTNETKIKIKRIDERFTEGHAGLKNRTGSMTRTRERTPIKEARWKSAVYSEERIPEREEDKVGAFSTSIFGKKHNAEIIKRLDELDASFARNEVPWKYHNTLLMNYSEREMEVHTQASIAYICARAYMESTVPEERQKADEMVSGISSKYPKAMKMARDVYAYKDDERGVWDYLNQYC